jgi:catechol-2,3-dioxygenase
MVIYMDKNTEGNELMFKDTKAFSSFSVDSIQKAKEFYGQILGLDVSESYGGILLDIHIDGRRNILIYPKLNHTQQHLPSSIFQSKTLKRL